MICPLHRVSYEFGRGECPTCKEKGLIVISSEFDKQDRIIDTLRCEGHEFNPERSRAILVFEKGDESKNTKKS